MNYYSTNGKVSGVSLRQAVIKGLADDKGLFMPDVIKRLPQAFLILSILCRFRKWLTR